MGFRTARWSACSSFRAVIQTRTPQLGYLPSSCQCIWAARLYEVYWGDLGTSVLCAVQSLKFKACGRTDALPKPLPVTNPFPQSCSILLILNPTTARSCLRQSSQRGEWVSKRFDRTERSHETRGRRGQ